MHHLPRTIAIDGPAASGKSVLAERLAEALGYFNFDTGLMYRAVTNEALQRGISIQDEQRVTDLASRIQINVIPEPDKRRCRILVDGHDVTAELHRPEVDRNVSAVSAYKDVRRVLVDQQRRIAAGGNIIMAGRDIGTVVLPDADCKIYLTASVQARAHRRMQDRLGRGQDVSFEEMREEVLRRDEADSSRSVAPLRPAEDAVPLDNSDLTIQETVERALEIFQNHVRVTV